MAIEKLWLGVYLVHQAGYELPVVGKWADSHWLRDRGSERLLVSKITLVSLRDTAPLILPRDLELEPIGSVKLRWVQFAPPAYGGR
jgi:hypothetical protein